jgi:pimeloyl-ACP methyl ester carboxylesterase
MRRIQLDDAELEYEVRGDGEPVLLVPLSVFIDGLAHPLFRQPRLCSNYRLVHYHRRGWAGSRRGQGPLSVARQAADAAALLEQLKIERAHVVGHSYGGVIALQLALDAPDLVRTVALLEPALRAGPKGQAHLERTIGPARARYGAGDKRAFITVFTDGVFGPGWEPTVERALPGALEQAVANADTFFEEQPALLQWEFAPEQAAAINQPVLSVLGNRSAAIFQEGRTVLHAWLPQTEDLDVDTSHMLQIEDPAAIADGLAAFFHRHPLSAGKRLASRSESTRTRVGPAAYL